MSGPGSAAAASHYTQTVCQTFQAKFGINVTRPGVVTNGRIVTSGPEAPSSGFTEDDFHLMGVYAEKAQHAGMVSCEPYLPAGQPDGPGVGWLPLKGHD